MAAREAMHATMLAEEPARDLRSPFVGAQAVFAGDQSKRGRLDDAAGQAGFRADAAVATAAAFGEVDLELESDGAAVAAAGVLVSFVHGDSPYRSGAVVGAS